MGALRENSCYPSQAEAVDAYFLGAPVSIVAGQQSQIARFEKVGGTWMVQGFDVGATGTTLIYSTPAVVPVFPDCDELQGFKDGLAVGWMVAAALIGAAALMALRRGAR